MIDIHDKEVKRTLLGLTALYNRPITRDFAIWVNALEDLTNEEFIDGVYLYLKSPDCKFFPMPGMIIQALNRKKESTGFYSSSEWLELRYLIIAKHKGQCMACGCSDKIIHVDHIKPRSKYPELALDESNLQILCGPCNMGKGTGDETDWRDMDNNSPKKRIAID